MIKDFRQTLLVCSTLLRYPDEALSESLGQLSDMIDELPQKVGRLLREFLDFLKSKDWVSVQEIYVSTFDMDEECSLYLTYNTLKDDSARGVELQRLKSLYRSTGLSPTTDELPDYLPMFLEYVGISELDTVEPVIQRYTPLVSDLALRLEKKGSPYALVVRVCADALNALV
ncbi:MAG: nitrate reductase molybdenum cofactor assembly chaperone [Thermoprotei archaeon]